MTNEDSQSDPFSLTGVVLDGRFRIVREIAEGGFGVVYRAVQIALDRPVALKVLKTPAGMNAAARAQFHERFAAEAKTIARVRHPNIVDVYDFGVSPMPTGERAPWMALEWLDGKTLADELAARRGRGGQSPAAVLALLRPVLRAFAYAHRDGIVHRDIKPANIMVVADETNGGGGGAHADANANAGKILRVLDFGIAKVVAGDDTPGSGLTRTAGSSAFSPHYAAPEQVAFGRTGPWTDVHALGLLLTEMLTDQPPYAAADMQLFEEAMSQRRPTPAARDRDVGPWEPVLARAAALSPGERWKDAGDLLMALEATVDGAMEAVSAAVTASATRTVTAKTAVAPTGTGTRHFAPDAGASGTAPAPITRTARPARRWPRFGVVAGVVIVVAAAAVGVGLLLAGRQAPAERAAIDTSVAAPRVPVAPAPPPTATPTGSPAGPLPPVVDPPPPRQADTPTATALPQRRNPHQKATAARPAGHDSGKKSNRLLDLAGDRQ